MTRLCKGCETPISPSRRERNRRKWCSEACRQKAYREAHPEYRARMKAQAAEKHRATYKPASHVLSCATCGESFQSGRRDRKYCSDACRFRAAYVGRRGRQYGAAREPYTVLELAERDGWDCQLCHEPIDPTLKYPDPNCASVDHVIPLALGGDDTRVNVQLAHLTCNKRKGARAA